ncbi:hypothetical protein FACS1894204_11980 [Synergistales bacterium]|nr:hypothetical protein FACS1894204_11980 [Synergistales bacterium]
MPTSLTLSFLGSDEKSVSITYPYADSSALPADVKTLMTRIITNKDIFAEPPLTIRKAEFIDRTVTPVAFPA